MSDFKPYAANIIPVDLKQDLTPELDPAEKLIWADRPKGRSSARRATPAVIMGVLVTAFSVFVLWKVMGSAQSPINRTALPLMMAPMLLLGIGLMTMPYWGFRAAARTAYGLTDRRAIVKTRNWRGRLSITSFTSLNDLKRVDRGEGTGDLIFEELIQTDAENQREFRYPRGFFGIEKVAEVEQMVRTTLGGLSK